VLFRSSVQTETAVCSGAGCCEFENFGMRLVLLPKVKCKEASAVHTAHFRTGECQFVSL